MPTSNTIPFLICKGDDVMSQKREKDKNDQHIQNRLFRPRLRSEFKKVFQDNLS